MWGVSIGRTSSFSQLYKFLDGGSECVIPIGSPIPHRKSIASFCFDGKTLYASCGHTQQLYIVNRVTGELQKIARWQYTKTPSGYEKHPLGGYLNTAENVLAPWAPDVTGLAFDGTDMYAIESFTKALYKLEKR